MVKFSMVYGAKKFNFDAYANTCVLRNIQRGSFVTYVVLKTVSSLHPFTPHTVTTIGVSVCNVKGNLLKKSLWEVQKF